MDAYSFATCPNLKEIVLPSTLKFVYSKTFYNLKALTNLSLPGAIEEVPSGVLYGCTNVTSLWLEPGIQKVDGNVFNTSSSTLSALTTLYLPEGLTEIGNSAFANCALLKTFKTVQTDENGALVTTDAEFPTTLTNLGNSVFSNTGLTSFTLPSSWTVGDSLLKGCKQLTSVSFAEGVTSVPKDICDSCTALTSVDWPSTVTAIEDKAFYGCSSLSMSSVQLPETIATVGADAFYKAFTSNILAVTMTCKLPKNLRTISNNAFRQMGPFNTVEINPELEKIGSWAFAQNPGLRTITWEGKDVASEASLPETVTRLEAGAFNRTGFDTFILPKSVEVPDEIPEGMSASDYGLGSSNVFGDCVNLKVFGYEEGIEKLPAYGFANIKTVAPEDMVIPSTLTELGNFAFQNAALFSEEKDVFPNVTTIGNSVFQNDTALTTFYVPSGLESAGTDVFDGSGLTKLVVPKTASAEAVNALIDSFADLENEGRTVQYLGTEQEFENSGLTVPSGITVEFGA